MDIISAQTKRSVETKLNVKNYEGQKDNYKIERRKKYNRRIFLYMNRFRNKTHKIVTKNKLNDSFF